MNTIDINVTEIVEDISIRWTGLAGADGIDGSDASVTKENVEAVLTGSIDSHTHSYTNLGDKPALGSIAPKDFWSGTQAAYIALGAWDNNTLYFTT